MKAINLSIGMSGSVFAALSAHEAAATFAGIATGLWMLRQLWLSFRR